MKSKKRYCRISWFKDSSIMRYTLSMLIFSVAILGAISYEIIQFIFNNASPISLKNGSLIVLALFIGVSACTLIIKLNENPIVTKKGLSIPLDMADLVLRENAWIRVFIPWADIIKMNFDSTIVNQWDCIFVYKTGTEIKLSSQMGYTKDCLKNLIELSEELKQKGIKVEVSSAAIQLANE